MDLKLQVKHNKVFYEVAFLFFCFAADLIYIANRIKR